MLHMVSAVFDGAKHEFDFNFTKNNVYLLLINNLIKINK